jgi:hypothetical protein
MGYIGRAAAVGQTETVKDSFNGDNSTVAFTMSQSVSLDTDIEVFVGNVQQEPGSGKAYTVSGTTLTFSEAPPTGTANIYVIHRNSLQGTLLPPQNLGDRNYLIGGNLSLDADSAALNFGADSEITVTHVADTGLNIKHTATGDDKPVVLTLQTGETDIAQNDILGKIQFQAPDEGTGTDAILVAAGISAISEGDFSSSSNATTLQFLTGASEAASAKMSLTSGGDVNVLTDGASIFFGADSEIELRHVADDGLIIKHVGTGDGKEPSLTFQAGDTDIAQDDVLGSIFFQAPDEGTGTDAILVAAGIEAVSEGDFSSSSNATSLFFKTGSSEAATNKLQLTSAGDLKILTDGASLLFGADGEIELKHVADDGLILKHHGTGDGKEPSLTFQAGDNDIAQDDVLGSIFFQAPDEGAGTDAILVAAGIEAVSEGDFSSSSNATSLIFKTGASETATEKMRLKSDGKLGVGVTPTVQFHVLSSSAQSIAKFSHPSSSTAAVNGGALVAIQNTNSTNNNQSSLVFNDSAGEASSGIFGFNVDHSSHEGFMKLCTRNSGGTFAERVRVQSGGGISFNGDTAAANALDDYEEGTWTPIVLGSTSNPSVTYSVNAGKYVKIGSFVHIQWNLIITNVASSGGGLAQVGGIPFAHVCNTYQGHIGILYNDVWSNETQKGYLPNGGQYIQLVPTGITQSNLGVGTVSTGYFGGGGSYTAAT